MRTGNTRQSCHKWFVISPKLERSSFTKMMKMPNCGESCQQFTVKSGVVILRVCQFAREKNKRSPEVGAGAFFALSRSRARSENKSAKARRKKSAKKSESAERERKKARIRAFPQPKVEIRFQNPKPLGRGKSKGLELDVQFSMLKVLSSEF